MQKTGTLLALTSLLIAGCATQHASVSTSYGPRDATAPDCVQSPHPSLGASNPAGTLTSMKIAKAHADGDAVFFVLVPAPAESGDPMGQATALKGDAKTNAMSRTHTGCMK